MKNINILTNISNQKKSNLPKLDAIEIYNKLKKYSIKDIKINRNLISILKWSQYLWKQYNQNGGQQQTSQLCAKYLNDFRIIKNKLEHQLSSLIIQNSIQPINYTKKCFSDIIHHLQQKSRCYWQNQQHLRQMAKLSQEIIKNKEQHEDEVKKEMLGLISQFKNYALQIGQDLRKDNTVIDNINRKQNQQMEKLQNSSKNMRSIIKDQKIGLLQLIFMAIIAISVWIMGIIFIMVI